MKSDCPTVAFRHSLYMNGEVLREGDGANARCAASSPSIHEFPFILIICMPAHPFSETTPTDQTTVPIPQP